MFGRKKNPQRLETIIGPESTISGELNVKGTIRVDGVIDGDVFADWVIVGEGGRIKGNVRSRGMVVGGRVEGNIDAEEIVELKGKAQILGEISTAKLAMTEGALFEGHSTMKRGKAAGGVEEGNVTALIPSSSSTAG